MGEQKETDSLRGAVKKEALKARGDTKTRTLEEFENFGTYNYNKHQIQPNSWPD